MSVGENPSVLCINYEPRQATSQYRMIALPRRVFECRGDISGLEQRIVFEDFLAAGPGRQQVEHILDADAQAAQAGPRGGFFRTGPSVPPGTYRVVLTVDGKELAQNLRIEADPTLPVGVTVADKDGGSSSANAGSVQVAGDGVLKVNGTAGDDVIDIQDIGTGIKVTVNGNSTTYAYEDVDSIFVDAGANPHAFVLVFQTTDVERAARLRKGDKVTLSGKLVQIVRHRVPGVVDDEWLLFDQVVIGPK